MESKITTEQIIQTSNKILKQIEQASTVSVSTAHINSSTIHTIKFQQISSTMLMSQLWPRQYILPNTYFIFTCKVQTKGKGQRTNQWVSPEGNLYMTILASFSLQFLPLLSVITGISTCKFISKYYNLSPQIKWINDVMINHKKVSGVLIKTQFQNYNNPEFIGEIGVGINVKSSPLELATSLQKEMGGEINVEEVRERFLGEFLGTVEGLGLGKMDVRKELKEYLMYIGQHVWIYDAELKNVLHEGIFEDINENANAIIKTQNGTIVVADGRMRGEKLNQ